MNGDVSIAFEVPDHVILHAELTYRNQVLDRNMVLIQSDGNVSTINVMTPKRVDYLLKIFAKEKSDSQSQLYQWVCEYQLKAQKGFKGAVGFPDIFQGYYDYKVHLFSPMSGYLKKGNTHHFELGIPDVSQVGVMVGDKMIPLNRYQSLFFGDISIPQRDVTITVYVQFNGQNRYRGILRYRNY